YGETVSKSTVSKLTEKLNPIVKEWSNRNLGIQQYSYLFVDATYIKVREADKVVSKAVYIGLGVKNDGKREIVGLKVAQAESEEKRVPVTKTNHFRCSRRFEKGDTEEVYWYSLAALHRSF